MGTTLVTGITVAPTAGTNTNLGCGYTQCGVKRSFTANLTEGSYTVTSSPVTQTFGVYVYKIVTQAIPYTVNGSSNVVGKVVIRFYVTIDQNTATATLIDPPIASPPNPYAIRSLSGLRVIDYRTGQCSGSYPTNCVALNGTYDNLSIQLNNSTGNYTIKLPQFTISIGPTTYTTYAKGNFCANTLCPLGEPSP